MSLQKRLVAVVALLLVIGLVVADVVTYASVRSFLYGQADNTLAQNESLGFNYLTYAARARACRSTRPTCRAGSRADVYVAAAGPQRDRSSCAGRRGRRPHPTRRRS